MRIKIQTKEEFMEAFAKFHNWFAWHPVVVANEVVFLETIQRKWVGGFGRPNGRFEYRNIN